MLWDISMCGNAFECIGVPWQKGGSGTWQGVQVICAGVWHNVVLCCMCWLLASLLPLTLAPLYSTRHGATVW